MPLPNGIRNKLNALYDLIKDSIRSGELVYDRVTVNNRLYKIRFEKTLKDDKAIFTITIAER